MDSHSLIENIRNENGEKELKEIYNLYRNEFLNWAKRSYSCSEEDAKEVFQQVIVIFYENIINGKLKEMDSKVKTYLFGIGKRKIMEFLRRKAKVSSFEFVDYHIDSSIFFGNQEEEDQIDIYKIKDCLDVLGDPCKSILVEFYYKKKNMDEISSCLNYKNGDTVKSLKFKCLKRLKKIYSSEVGTSNVYKA